MDSEEKGGTIGKDEITMPKISKILVLFKTHLDIGYTDYAGNVLEKYREQYIPGALRTAKELRESGGKERLLWTTGSFLIWDYLRTANKEQQEEMNEAVKAGDISWHGLACTTHTEIMDGPLFEYELSLSKDLDARFGEETIGAKMTDVPGHTIAVVPYLAKAGIRFLHIGTNSSCVVPDVPELFRWQYEGSEVIVMYNRDYGKFTVIPGTETAIYFAHTGDNCGPQSAEAIREVYRELAKEYPGAELQAADLNDVARAVTPVRERLPIVTCEIGDTWLHGTGTDPWKMRMFREILRRSREWSEEERREAFREILLVPEHTWGMDIKTHLGDHKNYIRRDFEKIRKIAPNYQKVEGSWEEQRDYVRRAVDVLSPENKKEMLEFSKDSAPDDRGFEPVDPAKEYSAAGWTFRFGKDGSLTGLCRDGRVYADEAHPWGQVLYENYSPKEYQEFFEAYSPVDAYWTRENYGKIGMEQAISEAVSAKPALVGLLRRGDEFLARMEMTGPTHDLYGAPGTWEMRVRFREEQAEFTLRWAKKPACRVPEAIWCGFRPAEEPEGCRIRKLGKWVDPLSVCRGGGLHLHGTDYGVKWDKGQLETLDTALVSVGNPKVMPYTQEPVHPEEGFWFNLENTIWGTNFVMWYDDDASFRWVFRP